MMKLKSGLYVLSLGIIFSVYTQVPLGLTPGEELRKLLFDTNEYDPDASPEVETGKTAVEISLEFSLQSLHSLAMKHTSEEIHSHFKAQAKRHQKSKTPVPVAQKKD